MDHDDTRADRQSANVARHLNQSYPDTVLFLARYAADRPDATSAELHGVTADGLLLQISTTAGSELVAVPLPAGAVPAGDIRAVIRELIRMTRERAPQPPLTSLERRTSPG